jgi:hypothetical protein
MVWQIFPFLSFADGCTNSSIAHKLKCEYKYTINPHTGTFYSLLPMISFCLRDQFFFASKWKHFFISRRSSSYIKTGARQNTNLNSNPDTFLKTRNHHRYVQNRYLGESIQLYQCWDGWHWLQDPSSGRCWHFLDITTRGRERVEEGRKGQDWLSSFQTGRSGAANQC